VAFLSDGNEAEQAKGGHGIAKATHTHIHTPTSQAEPELSSNDTEFAPAVQNLFAMFGGGGGGGRVGVPLLRCVST